MPSTFHLVLQNNTTAALTDGVVAVLPANQALLALGPSPTTGDPYDSYTFVHATCDQTVEDDGDAALLISRWGLTAGVNAWVVPAMGPAGTQTIDITASPGQVMSFLARVSASGDDAAYMFTVGDRTDATIDLFDSNDVPLSVIAFEIGGMDVVDCGNTCPPDPAGCSVTRGGGADGGTSLQTGTSGCTPTSWHPDTDGDTFGDTKVTVNACAAPSGHVADGADCNDTRGDTNPVAIEVCNTRDDNCDALVDDDDPALDLLTGTSWYPDQDGDNYGANSGEIVACVAPPEFVNTRSDCDDDDPNANPGGVEVPDDGIDQDCVGGDATTADTDTAIDTDPTTDTDLDTETLSERPYLPVDDETGGLVQGDACGCHGTPATPAPWLLLALTVGAMARSQRTRTRP